MSRPAKRKADAFELLRTMRDGPSIRLTYNVRMSIATRRQLEHAIKADVQLWLDTWVIPPALRLIPELKGVAQMPIIKGRIKRERA